MPYRTRDLGPRVESLPVSDLPGLPGWEWLDTPGHSPGHISFFRRSDRVLLAGDALATMDMDSWTGLLTGRKELARGGTPYNMDWNKSQRSVETLAELQPSVLACGHGVPMSDSTVAERLRLFATHFPRPRHGRYVSEPTHVDASGVVTLPPAPFDLVPLATAGALLLAGIVLGAGVIEEKLKE
jgi:glyoxylase-like metal-dependent hydrolase (beta-lactamase superfamily II)